MKTKSLWKNAKAVERLRALREEGFGFGRIAERLSEEFGQPLTRNAVAGMAYRLNLPRTPVRLPYSTPRRSSCNWRGALENFVRTSEAATAA